MQKLSLYRYSAKKWNDALIERGSIRIGTLRDFRKSEHKLGISDPLEGTKTLRVEIDDWNIAEEIPGSPSYYARASELIGFGDFSTPPNGENHQIRFSGFSVEAPFEDPDCFVYCTSQRLGKDVMAQFEGADSCVEIYDSQRFFDCLTAAIHERVPIQRATVKPVRYASRTEICNGLDHGKSPTWLKGTEFSPQYEARAAWTPLNQNEPIEWFILEIPELSRFCRRIKAK